MSNFRKIVLYLLYFVCILEILFELIKSQFRIIWGQTTFQKHPSRCVPIRRCSEDMQQIYRRTTYRSVILIKMICNFIEITLRHGCSPLNLLHIFRTPFYKNIYRGLLLNLCCYEEWSANETMWWMIKAKYNIQSHKENIFH